MPLVGKPATENTLAYLGHSQMNVQNMLECLTLRKKYKHIPLSWKACHGKHSGLFGSFAGYNEKSLVNAALVL